MCKTIKVTTKGGHELTAKRDCGSVLCPTSQYYNPGAGAGQGSN